MVSSVLGLLYNPLQVSLLRLRRSVKKNWGATMGRVRLVIPLVVALVAGCATDIPKPSGHVPSEQVKLRATHHWDVVAADIALQMKKQLAPLGSGIAVYVEPPVNPSPFEIAMHEFVITHLVEDGVRVDVNGKSALMVTLTTQLVTNASERTLVSVPLTPVAAGIMVAYNVAEHANDVWQSAAVLGSAAAIDLGTDRLTRPGGPSKTELIVTSSVADSGHFLMRKTDVYYIEDADRRLFVEPPKATLTREFRVRGSDD
jgi:hypothetical protein